MRETYSDSDDELLALLEAEGEDVVGSPCVERQIAPQAAARAETATQQRQPPPPLPAPAPAQQQRAVSAPAPPAPPQPALAGRGNSAAPARSTAAPSLTDMFAGTVGAPKLRSKALPSSAAGKAKTATSSGTARSAPPPADKAGDAMRETYSGLRIKNRLVSKSDMEMHMRNRLVVSLAQLPTTPAAKLEDPNIDWVTFGVLVSKGLTKTASSGSKYMLWQLSDLGGNAASVFLFGKAYEAHWKELEGAAVAVLNAKVLPNRSQGGGSPSLSVNQPGEIAKLGMSLDCGTCEGRRKDGVRCTMVINKAQGRFCRFHAAAQLKAIDRTGRAELQGSRRPATRPAAGSAKRGVSSARGRIIGVPMHGVYSAAGATGATGAAGGAGGAQGRGPSVAQQQKQRDQAQSQSQELARKMNMRTRGALGQGFRCMCVPSRRPLPCSHCPENPSKSRAPLALALTDRAACYHFCCAGRGRKLSSRHRVLPPQALPQHSSAPRAKPKSPASP